MLDTTNDISEGYEVISSKGGLEKIPLLKKPDYIKIPNQKPSRHIKSFVKGNKKDLRFEKLARNSAQVRDFVKETLDTLGFSYLGVEDQLQNIASMMMNRFHLNRLNCRMDLIHSDKCKKFHIDKVYIRSITTLAGPGTELKLGNDPDIYQVNTGETLLFQGSLFSRKKPDVLHRSPSIAHQGISRLVFVMDY